MATARHVLTTRTALLLLVAGAVALAAYVVLAEDRSEAASVAGTMIALVTAVSGLVPRLSGAARPGRAAGAQLQTELDDFAAVLLAQWSTEASARGLVLPAPIRVSFRWTQRAVADDPGEVSSLLPPGAGPRPVAGFSAPAAVEVLTEGTIDQLHDIYAGLPSGRLVVMGEAGTGKSGAAVLLLLSALAHRAAQPPEARNRVPVPVLLSLGEWLPGEQRLLAWVTARLLRDYAFLRRLDGAEQVVRQLVDDGSIALFLDGLDELAEGDRVAAVAVLSRPSATRIVMTSRPDEFEAATTEGHIGGAAVVELRPVGPESAAQYLLSNRTLDERPRWVDVVDRLERPGGEVVAAALSTPLMLSIARTSYGRAQDPYELFDASRFPDVGAVESYLLGRVVPSAYAQDDTGGTQLAGAERWLQFMAHQLDTSGSRDLAWWRMPLWVSPWARLGVMVVVLHVAVLALAVGLSWFYGAAPPGAVALLVPAVALLLPSSVLATTAVFGPPIRRTRDRGPWRWRLDVTVATGAAWLVLALISVVALRDPVLLLGAVLPAVVLAAAGLFSEEPTAVRVSWPSATKVVRGVQLGLVVGVLVALYDRSPDGVGGGVDLPRMTFWLASGALFGALFGAVFSLVRPGQSKRVGGSPRRLWWNDLEAGLVIGGASGLVWGTAAMATLAGESLRNGTSPEIGAYANLLEGLTYLPIWIVAWVALATLCTGAVRLVLACVILRARGRAPVRVLRFLEDARRRQVLRRVGGVYQFRHARLQDHLAQEYRSRQ